MKIRIILEGGVEISALSYEDIVRALKLDPWVNENTPREYMESMARRSVVYDGRQIEYTDAESFIKELKRIGVIEKIIEEGGGKK